MSKKINLAFLSFILSLCVGCFQSDITSSKPKTDSSETTEEALDEFEFPLSEEEELERLGISGKSNCIGDIECSVSDIDRLADEFSFRSGKLILRGNLFGFRSGTNEWIPNSNLDITTFAIDESVFTNNQESDFHLFTNELRNYTKLKSGVNIDLEEPLRPIIVTQGKLGLNEREARDPGLCDVLAAERFEYQSKPPWKKFNHADNKFLGWPQGTGFFEDNDVFAGETLILCGEISILNRTLKLEAKNIIFYNTHIKVTSDRDMPTGLRIIAENLGYFGANVIESNIINKASGYKNSIAPTIDIGVSGLITKVDSNVPANNRLNTHHLKILMAEHE